MNPSAIQKQTFPVLGMSCAACAARVDKTLNRQPGVCAASVNYAAATATVEYDASQCSPGALRKAVQDAGYDLVTDTGKDSAQIAEDAHTRRYRDLRFRTLCAIALALPVAVIGMFFMDMPTPLDDVDSLHSRGILAGERVLHQRLEAAEAPLRQYGHTGSHQYGDRLSVQPVQHAISGLLAIQRHPSACIF